MEGKLPFSGRVALVTGANRGIGKSIAGVLMEQGAGVYVNGRDVTRVKNACKDLTQKTLPGYCHPIVADVSKRDQVERMVEQVIDEKGHIDFLVNNAGVTSRSSLFDLTDEHWSDVLDINLRGVFLCTQIVARHMAKRKFGRIVNATSFAALISNINRGVYAAAKAGVIAVTKVWAGELAPYGITVNAYIPGSIATEMTADQRSAETESLLNRISLRRFGTPEEVARVVAFLLSPAADYITGTAIDVSGGKFVVQNPDDAWQNVIGNEKR
jgi:3-oxoacyl-[acyl-carrier protein] reductase